MVPLNGNINPRPAGVWLVTRPAGGGGQRPPEISQTTGPISKFQTPFDSPVRELPVQGKKIDPVTSASKISMLSANKANESACIVSLTSVSIISCAL